MIFLSQTICLVYYSQDRETVLANVTKRHFYKSYLLTSALIDGENNH